MESLVRYKQQLLKLTPERPQLAGECRALLETLKNIDPMRRRRYEELGMCERCFFNGEELINLTAASLHA
jgi:hypothetical protein